MTATRPENEPDAPLGSPAPLHIPARVLTLLQAALLLLTAALLLAFLYTAARRLTYPFAYDWIEEGLLSCVRHLRSGQTLYQAPTLTYAPFLYTPLFLYASAWLSHLTGIGYTSLRLVTITATLGCFAALYGFVFTEVRRPLAAAAAVGCFAVGYPLVDAWFDVGRVDMLALFFFLCALWATRRGHPVLAALLWVCAFQTKQGALPIAVLLLCHNWPNPRRIALGLASLATALGVSVLWLSHLSSGWYTFYVFGQASGLAPKWDLAARYLPNDLLSVYGLALLLVLAALLFAPPSLRSPAASFYTLGTLSILGITGFIRGHVGASSNALLPAYAWIALLFGVALGRLLIRLETASSPLARPLLALLFAVAVAQLAVHPYLPANYYPNPVQLAARQAFEAQLRALPGDVLLLNYPEEARLAGKTAYASGEATGLLIASGGPVGDRLAADYAQRLRSAAWSAVIVDRPAAAFAPYPHSIIRPDLVRTYPLAVPAVGGDDTRFGLQPRWIYLPCSATTTARQLVPTLDTSVCDR